MRFKLSLDESIFNVEDEPVDSYTSLEFDDDFSMEDDHSVENVLPGPAEGSDTGVANELIALINDEWEAIQGYNNAIATLRTVSRSNIFYEDAISVLEEIAAEENRHVGQLQEVLKHISPNASDIEKGHEEAQDQLNFVGGKLQVQTWDKPIAENNVNACENETMCSLTDIDDDM